MLRHEKYVVKTKWDRVKDNLKGFFYAILIALAIRVFLVEPYKIPTPSMYPTILEGDMIMANKFWYGVRVPILNWKLPAFSAPESGDVVLFETPTYQSPGKFRELVNFVTFGIFGLDNTASNPKYFIKRTIGTPGDIVRIHNPKGTDFKYQLEINGEKMPIEPKEFKGAFEEKAAFTFYIETLKGKKHFIQFLKSRYEISQIYFPQDVHGAIYIPRKGDEITFSIVQSHDNLGALKEGRDAGVFANIHINDLIKMSIKSKSGQAREIETTGAIVKSIYYTNFTNSVLNSADIYGMLLDNKPANKKVEENFYFVMGDNRDNSSDSRFWGMVNQSLIIGNPLFRHWPFGRFGKVDRGID